MGTDQMEPEKPEEVIGRRVSCNGDRATVRYLGPVPPTAGLWLGVEWDNPERGKHDGSHEGVHYFSCRHPKGASFIRPAKASFGVDYVAAVRQVYSTDAEEVLSEEVSIFSKKLEWWAVEERSFETLPSVLLNQSEVNGPGAEGEVRRTTPSIFSQPLHEALTSCPRVLVSSSQFAAETFELVRLCLKLLRPEQLWSDVQWLDLSGTLVSSWEDVAAITEQLDRLEGLQLSNNRLSLAAEPLRHRHAFTSLRVLVLNACQLTWTQVLDSAPMWPQVEDLRLEGNDISELQRPEDVLQSLRCLDLSNNPLVQDSVLSLSTLSSLEQLNLSRTGLSEIRFQDAAPGSHTVMFPALKNLNLDHNNITEWRVVDELAKLPSLVQFSCRGNRLVSGDGNPKTANQMLMAKLGQLVVLNNCEIQPEERRGAELDYIKMFGEEWLKAGGRSQASEEFTSRHPRYQKLIDKYGAPEEGELKKQQPFTLKNQLLNVSFVFPDDSSRKPIEKKLPASMEVQKVKGLLYRLLKVPATNLRLSYSSHKMEGMEFALDSDLKTLQFYSIEDGDRVLVRWS